MRSYVAIFAVLAAASFSACGGPPPTLEEGRWTGTSMPTGHPEGRVQAYMRVSKTEGGWSIKAELEGDASTPAKDVELTADTLKFVYEGPEGSPARRCAFGLQANGSYEGLCTGGDTSKYVILRPPDPSLGQEA